MATAPAANLLDQQGLDDLVKSIGIPPRPSLLVDVQQEMAAADPDPRKIAKLVARDVAMSAALLKSANSAFFGLKRKAETVDQAAALLGLTQCSSLIMGLIARHALNTEGPSLSRFWDVSSKRAQAMTLLARSMRVCQPDIAHTFGLFCDIGIPLLIGRFPGYVETLAQANNDHVNQFTTVEDLNHRTNHATIGALLARSWGLSSEVALAIRLHHEYGVMAESATSDTVRNLIALSLLSERAIQLYEGLNNHVEWNKGGELACEALNISNDEMANWCDELHVLFGEEN